MREIKFRFYSESSDSMSRAFTLEELCNGKYDFHEDAQSATKLQFTGLKDKNGVEIYEGDIVKGSAYEKEIYTGVVEFYDASFIMKIDGSKGYYRLNKMTFQELEVIGNIYEDSHLLDNNVE